MSRFPNQMPGPGLVDAVFSNMPAAQTRPASMPEWAYKTLQASKGLPAAERYKFMRFAEQEARQQASMPRDWRSDYLPTLPPLTDARGQFLGGLNAAFTEGAANVAARGLGVAMPGLSADLQTGLQGQYAYDDRWYNRAANVAGSVTPIVPVMMTSGPVGLAAYGAGQGIGQARIDTELSRRAGNIVTPAQAGGAIISQGLQGAAAGYLQGKLFSVAGKLAAPVARGIGNTAIGKALPASVRTATGYGAAIAGDMAANAVTEPAQQVVQNLYSMNTVPPPDLALMRKEQGFWPAATSGVAEAAESGLYEGLIMSPFTVGAARSSRRQVRAEQGNVGRLGAARQATAGRPMQEPAPAGARDAYLRMYDPIAADEAMLDRLDPQLTQAAQEQRATAARSEIEAQEAAIDAREADPIRAAYEAMSSRDLWNAVRARGGRAGFREANIETLIGMDRVAAEAAAQAAQQATPPQRTEAPTPEPMPRQVQTPPTPQIASGEVVEPGTGIPDWARDEMVRQGKNPDRLLNDVDAARPETAKQLANDPVTKYLETVDPAMADRARRGDLSAKEYGQAMAAMKAAKANPAPPAPVNEADEPFQQPTIAARRREVMDALRHEVAIADLDNLLRSKSQISGQHMYHRAAIKNSTVGYRVMRGDLEPKALVSEEEALRIAAEMPEGSAARNLLLEYNNLTGSGRPRQRSAAQMEAEVAKLPDRPDDEVPFSVSRGEPDLFGRPVYDPQGNQQLPLFHEPVDAPKPKKTAEEAKIERLYRPAADATGNMFEGSQQPPQPQPDPVEAPAQPPQRQQARAGDESGEGVGRATGQDQSVTEVKPTAESLKPRIRMILREFPGSSIQELGSVLGVKPHGYSDEGNPLANPLNQALKEMRDAGEIDARFSAMGSNVSFRLVESDKPAAPIAGDTLADTVGDFVRGMDEPVEVDQRRTLDRALYDTGGQLRGVVFDDGTLAVGDAGAMVHDDIAQALAGGRKVIGKVILRRRDGEVFAFLTEGDGSALAAPVWARMGMQADPANSRLLVGTLGKSAKPKPADMMLDAREDGPDTWDAVARPASGAGKLAGRTLQGVPMPELVKLAKELMGHLPAVQKLTTARGMFIARGRGHIAIDPTTADETQQLAQTLAHEIGHLTDFLPDGEIDRGNLLARVKSLKPVIGALGRLRVFIKNTIDGETGPTNRELRAEIMELSAWWRPGDMTSDYRRSSVELYADALSAFLNSPGDLAARAPKFYAALLENLDRKPQMLEAYLNLQDLLAGDPDELAEVRRADIREGFADGETAMRARAEERRASTFSIIHTIQQALFDRAAPLIRQEKALAKRGLGRDEQRAARYALEELALADNVNHLMLDRIEREVVQPTLKLGVSMDDLGEYLLLRRIMFERTDIANPFGHTSETARVQMQALKRKLGDKAFAQVTRSMGVLDDIVFAAAQEAAELGTYSRSAFEKRIAPNRGNYAAFAVVDHVFDRMPAGLKAQVGTFKPVANPFTTTIMKTISLNRLNELQRAKLTVRDQLLRYFPEEISKLKSPESPTAPNTGKLELLENGLLVGYEVDPYIGRVFQHHDVGMLNNVGKVMQWASYKVFHPLFVTYNPVFHVRNLFRDFQRTWKNLGQHATIGRLMGAYVQSMPSAWRRARGITDEAVREMLSAAALDVPFVEFDFTSDSVAYERLMDQYGLGGDKGRSRLTSVLMAIPDAVEKLGVFMESLPKLAAWKLLGEDDVTGQERSYIVRNNVGTPNIRRKGLATNLTNGVWMYSNVFIQGIRADMESATSPRTAAGFWLRTALVNVLPKLAAKAALAGLFGVGLKKLFEQIPSYDLVNHLIVPLGMLEPDDQGRTKAAYFLMPQDETGRLIGAMVWMMANADKQGIEKTLQGITHYNFAFGPNLSPAINIPMAWMDYARGINPFERFFRRNVVAREAWDAGGWHAARSMVRWTLDQGGYISTVADAMMPDENGLIQPRRVERVIDRIPGLRQLIRITDKGLVERQWDEIAIEDAESARFRIGLPDSVRPLLHERYRLGRVGVEKLEGPDMETLAGLDGFYSDYLDISREMKIAKESGDTKAFEWHKGRLDELAKDTGRMIRSTNPEDRKRLREMATAKVLRSRQLTPAEQDEALRRAGLEKPVDLDMQRELAALRKKAKAYGEARERLTDSKQRPQAIEAMRSNRLTARESARLAQLEKLDQNIDTIRKRMEAGKLDEQVGRRMMERLVGSAQKGAR